MRDAMQCPMLAARIYLKRRWRRFESRLCRRVRPHEFARSHEAAALQSLTRSRSTCTRRKSAGLRVDFPSFSERDFPGVSCGVTSTRQALDGQVAARMCAPDNLGAETTGRERSIDPAK